MVYRSPVVETDEGDQISGGTRVCRGCDVRQPVEHFHFANKRGCRRRKCKTCTDAMMRRNRAAKPELYARTGRAAHLRTTYSMTIEDWDALIIAQTGRCAICSAPLTGAIHVDHCHDTGRVRGLLDFTCNTALGKFRDSIPLLRAAIAYLEAYR